MIKDNKMTTLVSGIELQQTKIASLEEGRKLLSEINSRIMSIAVTLSEAESNERWTELSGEKYELVKARRSVQAQMAGFVRAKAVL